MGDAGAELPVPVYPLVVSDDRRETAEVRLAGLRARCR